MCQCPLTGYSHFYSIQYLDLQEMFECVNALQRATPISTIIVLVVTIGYFNVNALQRATTISTPALSEAAVYKALKGVFSPRFLKLLQKCYILPVFWFFQNFTFSFYIILPHFYNKCQDFF